MNQGQGRHKRQGLGREDSVETLEPRVPSPLGMASYGLEKRKTANTELKRAEAPPGTKTAHLTLEIRGAKVYKDRHSCPPGPCRG